MTTTPDNIEDPDAGSFVYVAQTFEGKAITGTIDATDRNEATSRLADLRLRVMRLAPAPRTPRRQRLGGDDFAAFNQQLAHLSAAGLPIESGLRLIAEDLGRGGLAQSVRDVSNELEKGVELGEAFKRHERQFPALYGVIIDAGVRAGDLPAVLLNLGRHVEFVAKLRAAVWRAIAYPLAVLCGMLVVMIFLRQAVVPQFQRMYHDWFFELPAVTKVFFAIVQWTPAAILVFGIVMVGTPILWSILRVTGRDTAAADLALSIPLIGPIMRRNLVARWCDGMRLCIQTGMDLPGAVRLSCQMIRSAALTRDGSAIVRQLESGNSIAPMPIRLRIIPPTVLTVLQLSIDRNELPNSLETMSTMYQQQASMQVNSLHSVLTPAIILILAAFMAFAVIGLFAPILSLFGAMTGIGK